MVVLAKTATPFLWSSRRFILSPKLAALTIRANSTCLLEKLRQNQEKDIIALPEYRARSNLLNFLRSKAGYAVDPSLEIPNVAPPTPPPSGYKNTLSESQILLALDAAMATFHLHVESRIASLCGQGFYTIGPCGEEMLGSIGHVLDPEFDAMALHYRHLSASIVRQLRLGRSMKDIIMDRARGYTVSKLDPVTGGVHCAIGSARDMSKDDFGGGDYVVTSTLASQCPPAVGRALGFSIADTVLKRNKYERNSKKQVSFVTIGDGSVHNAHFLSAFNLARHARFRKTKCPVVFGVSDNGLSISYPTDGYADYLFTKYAARPKDQYDPSSKVIMDRDGIPIFKANGCDMMDVYDKTFQAVDYSRKSSAPSLILYQEITRRFGHAATDRQHAYLDPDIVDQMAETDVIESGIMQAVEHYGALTYGEAMDRFEEIGVLSRSAFNSAADEPKISTRDDMIAKVSQPMAQVPPLAAGLLTSHELNQGGAGKRVKKDVMRKHMTRVISEVMDSDPKVVYIGEDVEHGGYYLVTEGLAKKFPGRVIDFPPDETTLLGAAMGFSQVGLVPIVEIPYSKYLDCGADMFYELAISNWLTNAQRPNGMVVRIQGFDKGVFGGNFHTHNMINHIPPGVDLLCYSNGTDYVRGFRNAVAQAKNGRVVALVDCTNLLNLRHLHDKDRGWETPYPTNQEEFMSFDNVRRFGNGGKTLIVSYGNGVVTALRARRNLVEKKVIQSEDCVDIIDCPYISDIPGGLRDALSTGQYDHILFIDICKEGPGSNVLSSYVVGLQKEGTLPAKWSFVAAPRAYNPLGNVVTFLNEDDVSEAFVRLTSNGA